MEHPARLQAPDPSEALKAGLGHSDRTKPHQRWGASTTFLKKRDGGSGIPSPYIHGSVGKRSDEQALVQDV